MLNRVPTRKRTPVKIREVINQLLRDEQRLQALITDEVCRLQRLCTHPVEQLRECDYLPSDYGNSMPEMRVCLVCGFSEEGWGRGRELHWNTHDVPKIPRQQLYDLRLMQCQNQMEEDDDRDDV
jgi:hypothetical protein